MKVLIATPLFPPDIGGPATYSKQIAEEFVRLGHEIRLVAYAPENYKSQITNHKQFLPQNGIPPRGTIFPAKRDPAARDNFQTIFVSRKLPKGVKHIAYFWRVLKYGKNADIVFAQDPVSVGFPLALAAFILRKPLVLKVVGDYAWEQGVNRFGVKDLLDDFLDRRYGFRVGFLRGIERFAAKRARVIIVPSQYLKSVVERWGVNSEKIKVIYNSVSVPKNLPSKEEAKKEFGLSRLRQGFGGQASKVLVSIGRLVPWKGFEMLIELMPEVSKKYPDARLFIIGSGPEREALKSQITNHKSQDIVKLLGEMSHEHILRYLCAADIFLLNTGYEGFSHQILEAMAVGAPIISTPAGGNKEILRDRQNSLVAGYNDKDGWIKAIFELLDNPALARSLAENAKPDSQKFTGRNMIEETINVL